MADDIKICLTLARALNGVIGDKGKVPWRIKADLKRFKALTMGKPVIMGRTTFEKDIGRALPGRVNIVLTRNMDFFATGIVMAHGMEAALSVARSKARAAGVDEVHVIGGAEIYAAALPFADRIYLTEVQLSPAGDTVMVSFDPAQWRETSRECVGPGADGTPGYCYVTLEKSVNAAWTIH